MTLKPETSPGGGSELRLGIDIGSTTVKLAVADPVSGEILYSRYVRHHAKQRATLSALLTEAQKQYPKARFRAAVCGSGGKPVAEELGLSYIQEVVANASAVCDRYPRAKTAVELGGQDAKVVFFYEDKESGKQKVSDMRMNGSCAGGTGAFIDEIAALLGVKTEEFNALAEQGSHVYEISGRCGVFAKTDIQPLLIQGAPREDIALSTFHAIARQTIGGLSQGLELKSPIVFEGGPFTFNPELVRVFGERLGLSEEDMIIPERPETMIAAGTALAIDQIFPDTGEGYRTVTLAELIEKLTDPACAQGISEEEKGTPFFASAEERREFEARHQKERRPLETPKTEDGKLRAYLGIDSGSTTAKMVLIDEEARVIDRFYENNRGEALQTVCRGIRGFYEKYRKKGIDLEIIGAGTTGYGEKMMAKAFRADYHVVETVAHACACTKYYPDTTFLLDIGGQDMKAVWLDHGIITDIMLNEACSSGCGSFLENFADNLNIPVEEIAENSFAAESPAKLGSRCTVFMNSTIINEQRAGKKPEEIMAGLCRAIIENVFTKVVRISGTDRLGGKIVVQGGTFNNPAVVKAIEDYLGKNVTLAPYPGEMGALGAALLARDHIRENGYRDGKGTSFIGEEGVKDFHCETQTGMICHGCANRCSRTVMTFSGGSVWVTGNKCIRGEKLDSGALAEHASGSVAEESGSGAEDLFEKREQMLFSEYPCRPVREEQGTVGLPRTLEFWDSMPFWSTFFRALGYKIRFSRKSSQKLYEEGLQYVASDTICFPAKLAHGHIEDLRKQKVDRIFMPYVMHMPPEGKDKLSPYVCSVVMGYPMVIRNSQDPQGEGGPVFDTPVFHWFTKKNRKKQICAYAREELGASAKEAEEAFSQASQAIRVFRSGLREEAQAIIKRAEENHAFAVVLAGRPYHTDPFISHNISKKFAEKGISVIPVDALSGLQEIDLSNTRIEITNNFHTRMLAGAYAVSENAALEYVQLVSFGCGHDAVLSDEIIRIMKEKSGKTPLILKIDESEASGALDIRIQSFVETVKLRKKKESAAQQAEEPRPLPPPSPVKFYKKDKKKRTLLVPNISKEVSVILDGILDKENFKVRTVPVGGTKQVSLGKQYVHNDICFPCQMVIGELISELKEGAYDQDEVAVCMVKFQCDCRMSHYAGLLRKGLDAAGFSGVPVVTTDAGDTKDMHPGVFLLGISAVLEAVWSFMMLDILTDLCRKIRPYEIHPGETERVYQNCVAAVADGIRKGISDAKKAFDKCIDDMSRIPWDRSRLKNRVFVTGELLVTYHPGSNFQIEQYLEKNGMETVFPRITDQLRKDFRASACEIRDYQANIPPYPMAVSALFDYIQKSLEKTAARHPLYQTALTPAQMYKNVEDIIPETLSCGEGWLMAAEIAHYAEEGVRSFVILQPFGCLPNHICGRGVIKKLKERYPDIQILPLDLDPDTSFANVENRLQMMLMNK